MKVSRKQKKGICISRNYIDVHVDRCLNKTKKTQLILHYAKLANQLSFKYIFQKLYNTRDN